MKAQLLIFLLVTISAVKTTSQQTIPNYLLDSNTNITAFGEDGHFWWFGTTQGLYRYDIHSGKMNRYTSKKSRLPSDNVTSICCTANGQTYIGTSKGILVWDRSIFFPITTENSDLPENYISGMVEDKSGALYICTLNAGLVQCTGNPIKPYKTRHIKHEHDSINSMCNDIQGDVWVEFSNGDFAIAERGDLYKREKNEFIKSLQSDRITSILELMRGQ